MLKFVQPIFPIMNFADFIDLLRYAMSPGLFLVLSICLLPLFWIIFRIIRRATRSFYWELRQLITGRSYLVCGCGYIDRSGCYHLRSRRPALRQTAIPRGRH